jgi:CheY-like chemotaxis protein
MSDETAPTVLIVEDYADTRDSLVVLLSLSGYRTAEAANGREALAYLRNNPPPCLILLDLRMPVMSGIEFLHRRNQAPALAAIPVLVCSGESGLALEAASYGAMAYCRKPIEPTELLSVVARVCGRTRG